MVKKIADYEIIEKIASGGMADVFKAKKIGAEGFTKVFAIKFIKDQISKNLDLKRMFIQEAELSSKLVHPNIIQIFELSEQNNILFIVMEYVHGKNLKEIDKLVGLTKIGWEKIAYIIYKSALALHHAHNLKDNYGRRLGIVHRDVSPQNIMVSFSGDVKLADFGIAKVTNEGMKENAKMLAGKFPYMSPEQTLGAQLDERSDIFSLGVVAYELLTGKLPFIGTDANEIMKNIRQKVPEPPYIINKNVPLHISNIVMRCLEKDAEHRYSTAVDIAKDIEKNLSNLVTVAEDLGNFLLEKYTLNLGSKLGKAEDKTTTETQVTKTITNFLDVLRQDPKNVIYIEKTGNIYMMQGDYDKAMDYFQRGLAIEDTNFNLRFRLSQVFLRKKDKLSFTHHYKILQKIDGKNPNLELLHLQYLILFDKKKDASSKMKEMMESYADNIDFLLLQAEYSIAQKNYNQAVRNYLRIAEIDPDFEFFKSEVKNLIEDLYSSMFHSDVVIERKEPENKDDKNKPRLLVVDDEKNTRILLKIMFTDLGYEVDVAQNAFNVDKLLEMHHYDLIILDVLLPGKNGLKLMEELKGKKLIMEPTKVIMISGVYKSPNFQMMARKAGVVEFVEKPFTQQILLKKIKKHLNVKTSR